MKLKTLIKIILGVIAIIILIVIPLIMSGISENECKNRCNNLDALSYFERAGGGWTIDQDLCTCFFRDSSKTFRLGEQ
jgi:hypothetical protein